MKSVITAICLLIPLVIIFIIIDCKDFYSGDDVASSKKTVTGRKTTMVTTLKPIEQPTETKPVEKKPIEMKPVDTKPVIETKPVETKPTERKHVEMKSVTKNKPIETKHVTEEKFAPVAVPLVTAEDAEKLNAFAVFLTNVKETVVEGEIIERSELPDPQKSDYPNCRFTVHFIGNSIKYGKPCPKEILLVVEGFLNYNVLETNNITIGDKVECSIIPFDCLSEEYKSTQQADDINLFLLASYYVVDIHKISTFADNATMPNSGIFFSDGNEKYVSIFERHLNEPIAPEAKNAQQVSIQNDIKKMNRLLEPYNEGKIKEINSIFVEAWNKEKQKDHGDYNRIRNYVWRNIDNSFWCLPINYTLLSKPDLLTKKTLDGFIALKDACEANGVQLIVSLIPDLYVISARVINKDFRNIPDMQTATYVKQLSEVGVETIYSADSIISNYNRFPFAYFFPDNNHPADTAQDINSDLLVERLRRYDILQALDPLLFSVRQSPHANWSHPEYYYFPKDCDIGDNEAEKPFTCREILYDGKTVPRTSDASIMILGNSFIQTPMVSPETLPTLLSMKLLTTVDCHRVDAFGPFTSIASQILATPERFLEQKKAIIIQVGTVHLTQVNARSLMVNIREEDENRLLFDKRSVVLSYDDLRSGETDDSLDDSLWSNLPTKHVYQIGESGSINVASFSLEKKADASKSVVCMIPAVCYKDQSAFFSVNGKKKSIPTFFKNPFYSFISFELPPGTKKIDVSIEGKKGTAVAIRNIQIWQ